MSASANDLGFEIEAREVHERPRMRVREIMLFK